jgi:hypothetical protein
LSQVAAGHEPKSVTLHSLTSFFIKIHVQAYRKACAPIEAIALYTLAPLGKCLEMSRQFHAVDILYVSSLSAINAVYKSVFQKSLINTDLLITAAQKSEKVKL